MKNFIEKCINKTAHISQIDDYINKWHKSDDYDSEVPLHEYLGFTFEEYGLWIKYPDKLNEIIEIKKEYLK